MPAHAAPLTDQEAAEVSRWWQVQHILDEFHAERQAQRRQWAAQEAAGLPLGFGAHEDRVLSDQYRQETDEANERGDVTLRQILLEEVFEAVAETDLRSARDELVQVGAVVVKTIERIDELLREQAGG